MGFCVLSVVPGWGGMGGWGASELMMCFILINAVVQNGWRAGTQTHVDVILWRLARIGAEGGGLTSDRINGSTQILLPDLKTSEKRR